MKRSKPDRCRMSTRSPVKAAVNKVSIGTSIQEMNVNKVLVVPMMLGLALGLATAAKATVNAPSVPGQYVANSNYEQTRYSTTDHHGLHYRNDRCVGLAAGTAHRFCGTETGGPVGGLH